MTSDEKLAGVHPHERQVRFQQLEFYAFIHFTVNTFTDKEWGDGTESPEIFCPEKLDAEQWVRAVSSAGMKGLILTCKHHDGFCLWQSRVTKHTVAASPWKNGRGDVVREVSDACRKYGIKFGVYLSPWDRNCPLYGQGKAYDDFFIEQLTELLTGYGDIFSVWFDGACGEGPDGKKQYYDWERYYSVIRRLQPGACISVCGPDIRWCGNEAGYTRAAEWSVVPEHAKDSEIVSEKSQHTDDESFRLRRVDARDADLGSRKMLENEDKLIWYPAEVNTSIRPGWFWHESENDKVRSLAELIHIYNNSVGGNATFLLNIPPTNEGLIHENDVKRLAELGEYLKKAFAENLLENAGLIADGKEISAVRNDNYDEYYIAEKGSTSAELTARWEFPVAVGNIVLKENILCGQRVESFAVEAEQDGEYTEIYSGTVIGYKRIVPLKNIRTRSVRIKITDSRTEPTLAFLGIYKGE
ncbi:MAG: alpha-L-fucosidase [Huintestinicola sp.]|uniref:alpha-L-fucosidase n=1 Tax=Huintestinicola sp. TaxID=2981661 RepID=UPI003F0C2873